ncbi:hypothetical protein HPULCUR_002000 [Helicostylum pulchrum]|uniref:Uncharacterized protein n=1 Tax=Helicostylum pulchrum TaxID=562976 RepID=A0ABP9XRD0_9FUNG
MNSQKANGRSPSHVGDADSKRRRLVESQKNNMFRPTPGQSALIQNQLTQFFKPTESTTNSRSSSVEATSPLSNLKIRDDPPEKSRHELFLEQLRLREEHKRRQKQAVEQEKRLAQVQYEEKKRLYVEEQYKKVELKKREAMQLHIEKEKIKQQKQAEPLMQQPLFQQQKQVDQQQQQQQVDHQQQQPIVQQQQQSNLQQQQQQQQQQVEQRQPFIQQSNIQAEHQPQQTEKVDSDDDIIIDEEMTNKNVCIGMVKTDIVVEKCPLILIRDEQYEIVSLESEGKLNTDNYSFKVTSRSQPPRFYGWVPFKDTKILGPLVDHRLIWWDAVIPRGKATNTRTPLCIILYCRPDLLNTIAKYFESQRLFLKTPPFYNPACRYNNPHHHMVEQAVSYQHHHPPNHAMHNQQQNLQQQQYQNYRYQQQQQQQQQQLQGGPPGPYNHQQYAVNNFPNERQSQKDIEMLLASIPSDVPLLRKKKKSSKKKNLITILSEDEEESVESEESSEDELENGYVEGLKCHLMDHQIKGVSWMIDRENNQSSNGGILADMGLGKTIQTIALMTSTMTSEEDSDEEEKEEGDNHQITLIVTPLALIHQWVDEILTKTEKGKLRVLKHHGPNRTKNYLLFKRYDVVVTTYQVVASDMPADNKKTKKKKKTTTKSTATDLDGLVITDEEEEDKERPVLPKQYTPLKKNHGPLFQLNWHRIVLDEAQFIKNRTTKASLSCATLSSVKRWCLTGTPIQNNVDELYSLLRFLRIQPLSDYPTFKKTISIPIMNGDTHIAMNRLKAVLMAVMLRRTKSVLGSTSTTQDTHGEQIDSTTVTKEDSPNNDESLSKKLTLKLPTRQKTDILLTFTDHEQALYQLLLTKSKDTIQAMVGNQNRYMNMLCLLLRLRQACDHPQLILNTIENDSDALDIISDVTTAGSTSDINSNLSLQQQISCELCGRPNNNEQKEQTPYCTDCTSGLQSKFSDRRTLFKTSTKVSKLMEILKQTRESNPDEKTIVFSQFTSMLNLLEEPLKREGFKICRYDGSMSSQLRERSLSLLKHDSKTTVMLISLKCGSLGLNLTAANRVILVDLWWNPALEEQAIDRVHRIGQKLPVYVTRLLIENTVELKIVELQEKKAQLTKGALGDGLVKSAKLTASEIRSLFDL